MSEQRPSFPRRSNAFSISPVNREMIDLYKKIYALYQTEQDEGKKRAFYQQLKAIPIGSLDQSLLTLWNIELIE